MINDERTRAIALEVRKTYGSYDRLSKESEEILNRGDAFRLKTYLTMQKLESICPHAMTPKRVRLLNYRIEQRTQMVKIFGLRNLATYKEQKVTEQAFVLEGITIRYCKGLFFSQFFYKSQSLRTSIDIETDLKQDYLRKSYGIMSRLGYQEVKGSRVVDNVRKSRAYYLDYPIRTKGFKDGMKKRMVTHAHNYLAKLILAHFQKT